VTDTESGHAKLESFARYFTVLLVPFALLIIVFLTWLSLRPGGSGRTELDIIAHREDATPDSWTLSGRVREDGSDAAGARVWVIILGTGGNRDSPAGIVTQSDGQFVFPNLPKKIAGKDVRTIEIYARQMKDGKELKGSEILRSDDARVSVSGTTGPPIGIGLLAALLLLSMLLPFLGGSPGRSRYVFSMVLAVLFNFSVIGGIGYAMYKLHSPGNEGQVPSLGFISIFQGTYVERGPAQWLISLSDANETAPASSAAAPGSGSVATAGAASAATGSLEGATLVRGFGAPLWVLLLAVVGSGILTVSLITLEIKEPFDEKPERIREKIYNAVQLQVYILFAPICAIFVYQTMVMTNTAGQPVVVAVATLGAGAALNVLLKYAVEGATALFTKNAPAPQGRAAAGGH